MANDRIVDVGIIFKRDRLPGVPEKDQPIDMAMIATNSEGLRLRVAFWDYEHERIAPPLIMGERPNQDEIDTFVKAMHDRFQDWNGNIGMTRIVSDRREAERLARLEEQVRSLGGSPVA